MKIKSREVPLHVPKMKPGPNPMNQLTFSNSQLQVFYGFSPPIQSFFTSNDSWKALVQSEISQQVPLLFLICIYNYSKCNVITYDFYLRTLTI